VAILETFTLRELMELEFPVPVCEGYVYVMTGTNGLYKIGYSEDPFRREQELDARLPFEVELIAYFPSSDCKTAEATVHRCFAPRHVSGEWFDIDIGDLDKIEQIVRTTDPGMYGWRKRHHGG
jgi:hypothetical protein